jgi:tRNA A-37 threonylcarbamoyl transferase component Bud32
MTPGEAMDRAQLRGLQQHSQAHALSAEVPLPGLRVLGTLGISGRGTLYAVRWEPRSTREPALLALRVADDPGGVLLRRLSACASRTEAAAMDGLAVPIDHGTTASGRTYYTTELFERDLGRLPAALQPALPVLLTDVVRVLAAMHARGLVHGNLHAGNVLIKEHASSYSIALCDPAILIGREVCEPGVDLADWARLAAHAYGHRVDGDGRCVAQDDARVMPAGLADIIESVLAGGGPTPAQPWTARELAQALEGLAGADSGAVPRMRLAVGSGPTRSESAHARRALQRAGFEVLACVGQGAAATVFRVRRGGRELAAKVLHGRRAMERLACVEAALDRLRGAGDAPLAIPEELGTLPTGAAFYTMDVFASTLRGRASELDLSESLEILGEVARGLARLHRLGVVHRDVKPSNVLLTRHDRRHRVAVSDFELALLPDHEASAGELAGTPAQRPPEAGAGRVTPAWDVWSWAVTSLWVLRHQLRPSPSATDAAAASEITAEVSDAVPGLLTDALSTIEIEIEPAPAPVIDVMSDFSTEAMSGDEPGDAFWDMSDMPDPAWLRARVAELAPVLPASIGSLLAACLETDPARRPGADAVAACVTREVARLRASAAEPSPLDDPAGLAMASGTPGARAPSERLAGEPFAGLRALTEPEQCVGRAGDVACLVELLGAHRLVVLLGPAGAGKSSVLGAGLLPQLASLAASGGPRYRPIVLRPGPHPFASLAAALLASPAGGEPVRPNAAHIAHLAAALRKRGLAALAPLLGVASELSSERPLLIIDQAEELFTAVHDAGERHAFAALLGETSRMSAGAGVPVAVTLFAVRDGFYGQLLALPMFTASVTDGHGYHCLQPLDRAALQAVLEQGAARHNYVWEEGLAAVVAAQAADCAHALAVLQVTASELWRLRERETHMIPRAALADVRGDGSAIERAIERLMDVLVADDALWCELAVAPGVRRAQLDEVVRGLFLRLVDVEGRVARPLEASELWQPFAAGTVQRLLAERVVPRLVNGGLLACRRPVEGAVEHMAPADTVALVHDALIAISPRLQGWLAEEQPRRQLLDQVHAGAVQWEAAGRARAALWSGRALRRMRARMLRHRVSLRATEAAFWQACEDRARRSNALLAGTTGVLVLALLAALLALG